MRPRSAAAPGYSSWPRWDGPGARPKSNGIAAEAGPSVAFSGACVPPRPRCGLKLRPNPSETMMRFYNQQHQFYAGVDLHARTISLHILDADGRTTLAK